MSDSRLRGRDRVAVAGTALARAASGGLLATALVVYVGEVSPLAVGLLATAFFAGTMLFAPLWGAVADAVADRRRLLLAVSGTATLLAAGFAVVPGVGGVIALRGVYAAVVVGFGPVTLAILAAVEGAGRRGRSAGFYNSALAAGDVVGQVLVGVLLGLLAPTELYAVVAGFGTVATLLAVGVPDTASEDSGGVPGVRALLARTRARLIPDAAERRALRRSGLWPLFAGLVLRHTAVRGVGALVPLYLLSGLDASPLEMGLLLAVSSAAQVVLMPTLGRAADARSRRGLVLVGCAASAAYVLLLAAAALPATQLGRYALAVAAFLAIAVGFSALDTGVVAFIGDTAPRDKEGAFVGFRTTLQGVGGVVGPTLVAGLAVLVGYPAAFAASAGLILAGGLVVALRVPEPSRSRPLAESYRSVETVVGTTLARRGGNEADD